MTLCNSQIVTCPKCKAKKVVLGFVSGNNKGQTIWSDNKIIAPMLPRVSLVQKCPSCGHYYLLSRQKPEYGKANIFEKEELTYKDMKEAWRILKKIPNLTDNEKLSILIMQVWAFNDEYTRDERKIVPKEEHIYITKIIDLLLNLDMVDDLFKAELLRESGRFSESIGILDSYPFSNSFINKCKDYSLASSIRPFII